jgi:hypothetical protein
MTTEYDPSNNLISPTNILIPDVWLNIFSKLTYHNLLAMRAVNQHILTLLNSPSAKEILITAAFHQHWEPLIKIWPHSFRNVTHESEVELKKLLEPILKFFLQDKNNYFSNSNNKGKNNADYYKELSQTDIFANFKLIFETHQKIKITPNVLQQALSTRLGTIYSTSVSNELDYMLLLLTTLPMISQFILLLIILVTPFALLCANTRRTKEILDSVNYGWIMAAAIFPPLWFVVLGLLLLSPIKLAISQYTAIKNTEDLLWKVDELQANMEALIAYHHNKPLNDPTLENNGFDPKVIQQRDDLIALCMGDKFAHTHSTGIQNIQKTLIEHPNISCEKFFTLVQTEINQRASIANTIGSFFKDTNRNPNMQLLYNKVNGGQFGTGTKMDLISSSNDRKDLIDFMHKIPSFVFKPASPIVAHYSLRCVG